MRGEDWKHLDKTGGFKEVIEGTLSGVKSCSFLNAVLFWNASFSSCTDRERSKVV